MLKLRFEYLLTENNSQHCSKSPRGFFEFFIFFKMLEFKRSLAIQHFLEYLKVNPKKIGKCFRYKINKNLQQFNNLKMFTFM